MQGRAGREPCLGRVRRWTALTLTCCSLALLCSLPPAYSQYHVDHIRATLSSSAKQEHRQPTLAGNLTASVSEPSYQQTYDQVQALVAGAVHPGHSWAIGWDELVGEGDSLARKAVGIAQAPTAGPLLKEMLGCMHGVYSPVQRLSWDDITSSVLPSLRVVAGWWHSEAQPDVQATVVTFGSMERLQQLRAQCLSWQGPLSVLFYQPLLQAEAGVLTEQNKATLRQAVLKVMKLAAEMEKRDDACQLSLLLVYEVLAEEAAVPLYPLNTMRNLARLMVRTPLAVLMDVDLLLSKSLYTRLSNRDKAQQLIQSAQAGNVYILPAFELSKGYDTIGWAETLSSAPDAKLIKLAMSVPVVEQFHGRHYGKGHHMTRYMDWQGANEADFRVKYEGGAEPWVLGSTYQMPMFDERYRGWGWDKIQFVSHLSYEGFKFWVMHDAYTVHRPHPAATTMQKYTNRKLGKSGSNKSLKSYIEGLFKSQMKTFARKTGFRASLSPQMANCLDKLSWWQPAKDFKLKKQQQQQQQAEKLQQQQQAQQPQGQKQQMRAEQAQQQELPSRPEQQPVKQQQEGQKPRQRQEETFATAI